MTSCTQQHWCQWRGLLSPNWQFYYLNYYYVFFLQTSRDFVWLHHDNNVDRSVKLYPLRAPASAPLQPAFAHRLPLSDCCLLCPAGQFLWRRTWFELDRKRSSVHVVSASRHPKQYGLQPHWSLNRHRVGGWTEHAALFTFSFPSNCTKQPPGRIFTLWRQSWDFYQTPIFMSVHRIQLVASLWPEPPRLATIQDPDSIKNKTSVWKTTLKPIQAKCCALGHFERNPDWLFIYHFNLIYALHHAIDYLERNSTAFLHFDHTVSCITQVLKHLQQGIPLFCPKLRGTVV